MRQSLAEVDAQGNTIDVITSQLINYKNEVSLSVCTMLLQWNL